MAEFIEREALQNALQRKQAGPANKRYTEGWNDCIMRVKSMVHSAPAADVATVIRCRDCENWNTAEMSYFGTKCRCERFSLVGYSENYTLPNDFCSYGERRSDEN